MKSREHRELAVDDDGRRVMDKVGAGVMSGPDADLDAGAGAGAGNAAHERRPLIIYASRTHSQLAQVIRELKSTKYRPRMAVIGSRQQMCVHKDVRTLTGAAQNAACRARTASRSCAHHNELESFQMREPDFGR
jgi:regulator of telomere elongation helicase 1